MGYYEFNIEIPDESRDAIINMAYESGSLGVVETQNYLLIYFPDHRGIKKLIDDFASFKTILKDSGLMHDFSFGYVYLSERDWNESWKKKFQPIDVGEDLSIIPPWEISRFDRVNLLIDPGMAFGTGHHITTKTCLELIEQLTREGLKERFLDVGTGTGILAIGAAKLGFREVVGVDIDPLAIDAAKRNVNLNGLTNMTILEGTISVAKGAYDVIAANLMSEILIAIAPEISSRLKNKGIVLLSGMIIGQEDEVIAAMEKEGLMFRERYYDDIRWVSLVLTR
jgi:ribosomal protein L11 methyltransferase